VNKVSKLLGLLIISVASLVAEDPFLESQALHFQEKLETAVKALSELNEEIGEAKAPLLGKLNESRTRAARLRNDVETALLSKAERQQAVGLAKSDVEEHAQHVDYSQALAGDYLGSFEARLNISEDQRYRDRVNEIRLEVESDGGILSEGGLERRFEILDTSMSRLEGLLGGDRFEGRGVSEDGNLVQGQFLVWGPTSFFLSSDRAAFGLAESEANSLEPIVKIYGNLDFGVLESVFAKGEAVLPLDGSLGKASSIEAAKWSISDHVKRGGYVGFAIIGFAFLTALISLVKVFDFASVKASSEDVDSLVALVEEGENEKAMVAAKQRSYPYQSILTVALENRKEDDAVIDDVVIGEIQKAKLRFDRFLPFLAITAATTPLMGLLGTVVGMIKTFALITVFGSGEAKSLSSGISEALITTEFGLLVAIPALLLHGAFVRVSKEKVGHLEDYAANFLVGLRKLKRREASGH